MLHLTATLLCLAPLAAQDMREPDAEAPAAATDSATGEWTAREVEHLLNRAGFGARQGEIESLVPLGREALVERLLTGGEPRGEFFVENAMRRGDDAMPMGKMSSDARKSDRRERRRRDEAQMADFSAFWIERMLEGDDPLREKMTLFWHGHFATSQKTVKDSFAMIRQNELFHEHALGSFTDLAHGIVRDPAMLKYLDNDDNKKGKPNENLARELMELFTLGEGHYSEQDIKEAARALTGWSQRDGEFREIRKSHDRGEKSVLGETGKLDGDDLVQLLLTQDTCGPFVAGRVLAFFEGVEPSPGRAADYGVAFAESGYDISALLRRLFNDPEFYRPDVLANGITSPLEHVVGTARRLGVEPPARLALACSRALGQRVFFPPSVKGWDGGEAWITTSTMMLRANLAGVLLGTVSIEEVLSTSSDDLAALEPAMDDEMARMDDDSAMAQIEDLGEDFEDEAPRQPKRKLGDLEAIKSLKSMKWRPRLNLTARLEGNKKTRDGKMADALIAELLAVPVEERTRDYIAGEIRSRRKDAGIKNGELLRERETAERILREVAHVLLTLPEAQLH